MSSEFTRLVATAWMAFFLGFFYGAPPESAMHLVSYAVTTTALIGGLAGLALVLNLVVSEAKARVVA